MNRLNQKKGKEGGPRKEELDKGETKARKSDCRNKEKSMVRTASKVNTPKLEDTSFAYTGRINIP